MSTPKKTRADSVLGTLPEDRQEQIAEHARTHTLAETCAWLKADGLKISSGNLSSWLSDWRLSSIFRHSESKAVQFRDWLAKAQPALSEEALDQRAALMFQFAAVESGDAETWLAIASARQKGKTDAARLELARQKVEIDSRKLKLLEARAAQADAANRVVASKLTPEEKQLKLRQIFGMS